MWLLDKMLRSLMKRGELTVTDHDGKVYHYGAPDPELAHVRARLTSPKAAWHIAKDPRVGAGEAYMNGWIEIEPPHDVRDMVLTIRANAPREDGDLGPRGPIRRAVSKAAGKIDQINWRARSFRNAKHTYNLTRRLYELFLDEDRQYTMAYYRDPTNSLEQAQLDKKAHIASKLYLKPGMKVLDIGCGWGGLALYLHRHYDVDVLGVALAPDQIEFSNERAKRAGRFRSGEVRAQGLSRRRGPVRPDHQRRPDRASRHAALSRLLQAHPSPAEGRRGDVLALLRAAGPAGRHRQMDPQIYLPGRLHPGAVRAGRRGGAQRADRRDVEAMRYHYAHTLEEWYRRTVMHREEITALYDERFYRMWEFYLAGAEAAFRHGGLVNWQLQYVKRRDAIPMTRDYMYEEAERLRASDEPPAWHLAAE